MTDPVAQDLVSGINPTENGPASPQTTGSVHAQPLPPAAHCSSPHIRWIEDDQATDQAAEVYRAWKQANPGRERMPDILKCFSLRPDFLQNVIDFSRVVHFSEGHLTRRTKEMIATLVSGLNQCPY